MICGNCGSDCHKVTVKFHPDRQEMCENCADGGLHLDPAWKRDKPTPLWESRPHLYRKTTAEDGETVYMPTDENRADLEAQICKRSAEDEEAIRKRKNRQVGEIDLNKANKIAEDFRKEYAQTMKEYDKANQEYWDKETEDLRVQ